MILKIEITCICDLIKSLKSSMKLQLITPLLRSWAEQSNSSRASTWKEKTLEPNRKFLDDHLSLKHRQGFQEFFSAHSSQRSPVLPSFHFAEVECRCPWGEKNIYNNKDECIFFTFLVRKGVPLEENSTTVKNKYCKHIRLVGEELNRVDLSINRIKGRNRTKCGAFYENVPGKNNFRSQKLSWILSAIYCKYIFTTSLR